MIEPAVAVALAIICAILLLLLVSYHARVRRVGNRLTDAIRKRKLDSLEERVHHSPQALRELEKAIIDQLFAAERLEERVGHRELLLSSIVEGLTDAVIVIDARDQVSFANPKARELFNWSDDPVDRRVAEALGHHELAEMLDDCAECGEPVEGEIRFGAPHLPHGGDRLLEVDIAPLPTQTSKTSRTRMVLRDVTEQREVEQVRKDFVANASHELRTPLTIINGYMENLLDGALDDRETSERFIGIMRKHGDRLSRIIEDMLTISKLESSHRELLQMERFNIRDCAEDVLGRMNPVAEEKKAKLRLRCDEDTDASAFVGDRFYWDQILFNLVENALKENESPGLKVDVRISRTDDDMWEITVADTGVGILSQDLPFIFKRFFRGDKHHSSEKKGTGLGLSIVKRAIEAHGGSIEARSEPGIETAFTMRVPRLDPPPEEE